MKTIYMTMCCLIVLCVSANCSGNGEINGWPSDLPKFGDYKPFQVVYNENTGRFEGAMFINIKKPEKVYENYKKNLLKDGWVLEEENESELMWTIDYEKGEKGVLFTLHKDGAMMQLFYFEDN